MMKSKLLLAAIVMTVITSCTNKKVLTKNYALNDVEIKLVEIKSIPNKTLNDIDITRLYQMKLINSKYLILVDRAATDRGIQILDIENFTVLGQTGIKGEGPQEISNYSELIPFNDGFLMTDYAKKVIYYYDVKEAIADSNYLPVTYGPLKTFLSSLRITEGDQYIGTQLGMSETVQGALEVNLVKGDITKERCDIFTPHYNEISGIQTSMDPSKLLCYVEKGDDRISVAYTPYDFLAIYNTNGELIRTIKGEKTLKKRETHCYFRHAQFTPNDLFVDHQTAAIYKKNKMGKMQYEGYNTILCFDKNGAYHKTLKTDHAFDQYVVLPNKKEIILYRANSDNPFTTTEFSL
ncbi:hypothetical protein K5X82_08020 [Halosquirtibacter xylanolyticus]|uniref:hypothetical protein n=1 Tax=Halosquirtibacter xylanolyticus TaxID=3374599 RepID=UPI00374A4BDE|nr:hypothetical protein K5X82_08020 [Prolixibacteraceae bacterium]